MTLDVAKTKKAMVEFIERRRPTHFVSLAFNPNKDKRSTPSATLLRGGHERAIGSLSAWDAQLNRRQLGRHWQRLSDARLMGVAFYEHPDTNAHWHLLVLPPASKSSRSFRKDVEETWRKIEPNGTVDIQPITDLKPLASYVTKEIYNPNCYQRFQLLGPTFNR